MAEHHDVYERLAHKLADMPQGFPAADDHVELDILRWAFTPEEAQLAIDLPGEPSTEAAIAALLARPLAELSPLLLRMCKQGQISAFMLGGEEKFALMPWLPGIQEGQLYRRDRDAAQRLAFVHLWERYFPTYSKIASYDPPLARVVPVSMAVKSDAKPHRLDDVHRMVDSAKSFWVMPCICREERGIIQRACNHISQVCLVANAEEDDFAKWPEIGRVISKEEAHDVLEKAAADGLVHQTWNADSPSMFFICNCCSCCCVLLRPMTEFGQTHAAASNFVAEIDADECTQCGDCLDDRCVVGAISAKDGSHEVDAALCIGCGVCTVKCTVDSATRLKRKPVQVEPPTPVDWIAQRMSNRAAVQ